MKAKDELLVVVSIARKTLVPCMYRSWLFMAALASRSWWDLVAHALPCWSNYVRCRGRLPVGGTDSGQLDSVLGGAKGIDHCWGRHLRVRCCPYIVECIASASTSTIPLQNSMYRSLNQICNNLYSEHLIMVCMCVPVNSCFTENPSTWS
jgi:hypothetical protein